MKKIAFFAIALGAVMLASCGNRTKAGDETKDSDSVSFVQSQIEERMMTELDSLSEASQKLKPVEGIFRDGKIHLSENELKIKPTYLLDLSEINGLTTLSQKYRALGIVGVDRCVAQLYKMDMNGYKKAFAKLAADINDPALQAGIMTDTTKMKLFYKSEKEHGRLNYMWETSASTTIETLYILTQNIDKFITAFDDHSASNITYHLVLLKLGLDDLANYDPNIRVLDEAMAPLNEINAVSVAQLKDQLTKMKPQIEAARAALLK